MTPPPTTTVRQSGEGPWAWPEEGWLTGSSNGAHQASEGRDVVSVRVAPARDFLEPARSYSGGDPSENSRG